MIPIAAAGIRRSLVPNWFPLGGNMRFVYTRAGGRDQHSVQSCSSVESDANSKTGTRDQELATPMRERKSAIRMATTSNCGSGSEDWFSRSDGRCDSRLGERSRKEHPAADRRHRRDELRSCSEERRNATGRRLHHDPRRESFDGVPQDRVTEPFRLHGSQGVQLQVVLRDLTEP